MRLKIGEFSRVSQIPLRTLRYFDQIGLLKPAEVDRFTDYRNYSLDQLPRANRILALKDLGLSLEQIAQLIGENLSKVRPRRSKVKIIEHNCEMKNQIMPNRTPMGNHSIAAALGLLMRAWERDMRVGMVQFLKQENARYGEIKAAEKMGIDIIPTGDGFSHKSKDIGETKARAQHGWARAKTYINSGDFDLFVLDEFTYPLTYGWINIKDAIAWLQVNKPQMLHLVITGRHAPQALIEFADLVTEMQVVKHPLADRGIHAQAGVEF